MREKNPNQDWPNLKKYEAENTKLKTLAFDKNRIVFIGDSITEYWSTIDPQFFESKPFINRGISGQTSPQLLIRFRADVIDLKPNIVVILAGINDIAGNTGPSTIEMIVNNIFSMAELAKVHQIKVILCSVLPANHFYWKPNEKPAETVIAVNKMLKEYALANEIPFVDYHAAMADTNNGLKIEFGEDGVHPNKNGYLVMQPIIEKALAETLKK